MWQALASFTAVGATEMVVDLFLFLIFLAGHRLFYGDVISVGATEMIVEHGAEAETVSTSPPLQMHSGTFSKVSRQWRI